MKSDGKPTTANLTVFPVRADGPSVCSFYLSSKFFHETNKKILIYKTIYPATSLRWRRANGRINIFHSWDYLSRIRYAKRVYNKKEGNARCWQMAISTLILECPPFHRELVNLPVASCVPLLILDKSLNASGADGSLNFLWRPLSVCAPFDAISCCNGLPLCR